MGQVTIPRRSGGHTCGYKRRCIWGRTMLSASEWHSGQTPMGTPGYQRRGPGSLRDTCEYHTQPRNRWPQLLHRRSAFPCSACAMCRSLPGALRGLRAIIPCGCTPTVPGGGARVCRSWSPSKSARAPTAQRRDVQRVAERGPTSLARRAVGAMTFAYPAPDRKKRAVPTNGGFPLLLLAAPTGEAQATGSRPAPR
jgi:hypothetical protein